MTRKRLFKKSPAEFLSCLLLLSAFLFFVINHAAAADCQNQLTVRVSPATINCGNITSPQFSVNPSSYPSVFVMEKHYTLTAVPAPGYVFDYWTVNYTVKTAKTITVSVVDGQKTVTAYFKTRCRIYRRWRTRVRTPLSVKTSWSPWTRPFPVIPMTALDVTAGNRPPEAA